MNDLKFCSSPCQCPNTSTNLSNLSELKRRAFASEKNYEHGLNITEQTKYNKKVLLGNWYEERSEYNPPPNEWISNYNTAYKVRDHDIDDKLSSTENAAKNKKKQQGVGPELITQTGNHYRNNFSTAYDLTYRVLPKGLKGPRLRIYNARKDTYTPEIDLTENFGNMYGYGLKEYLNEKARVVDERELEIDARDSLRTSYQCEFTKKKISHDTKRFPRKHADMNTLDLRHLGIDLNGKWSRQYTHGFHRKSFASKT